MTEEEKLREKDASREEAEAGTEVQKKEKFAVWDETAGEYRDIDVSEIIRAYEENKAIREKVEKSPNRRELEREKEQQLSMVERMGVERPNVPVYLPEEDQNQQEDSYQEIELPEFENQLPQMASLFQTQLPEQGNQFMEEGGAAGCPQGYHWDEATQSCISNFFVSQPSVKSIDPLDATRKANAVKTLTKPPTVKKANTIEKVDSNSSIPKVQHIPNNLDKPLSLSDNLKSFDSTVNKLVTTGDAARVLKDEYFSKDNTKSLEQLTREALTSDPQFLQKIEADKVKEFKKNEQKAYDEAGILQKTGNVVSAFIADPILTGANLMSGQRPLMGQSGALRDEDNTSQKYYRQITGADNNIINDLVNIINPASYATSAGVNAANGNYTNAVVNLGEAFMSGADLTALGKLGVKGANLAGNIADAPRLSLLLQDEAARLSNPEAYKTLTGSSSGVRGKISDFYFNSLQKDVNKQLDVLSEKVYKARQKGQDDLAEQYLEEGFKLREKVLNEILPQQHAWRLKYSGLPISPTGKGGGQGTIYQNNLNLEELIKVGSYMGDEQSINSLIELGKRYNNPDAVVAFPTKAVPYGMGRENLQVAQFMPKLDYKDWMPDAMTPEQIKSHLNELNKLGIGIDYQGAGNIGSVGNKLGVVDLTYVGIPGNRTNHYFARQGVFNPVYRDTGKLGRFEYEVNDWLTGNKIKKNGGKVK